MFVATGFRAFNNQGIRTDPHHLFRQDQRRSETHHPASRVFEFFNRQRGRNPPGQNDVRYFLPDTDINQLVQARMHRDQVDAEIIFGHLPRFQNFLFQKFRRHGAAGDHAESAGV